MATVDECEQAFHTLAERLAAADQGKNALDRSLSCRLTDIDAIFGAQLKDGQLLDIRLLEKADAQIKLTMSSDDLIKFVAGDLKFSSAWAAGRVKVDARVFDLIRLRSIF